MSPEESKRLLKIVSDYKPLMLISQGNHYEIGYLNPERNRDGSEKKYLALMRFHQSQTHLENMEEFKSLSKEPRQISLEKIAMTSTNP